MDLIDKIQDIAKRVESQLSVIETEEATKNAFIMPFIGALGYDVFNPMEVVPEFTADTGTKKGEKVDYAIKKDDQIIMLIECKWSGTELQESHASQLYRYFSVTEARFAILTNGIIYKFYSDLDESNKMDSKPFFELNILDYETHQIDEVKKFTKDNFALDNILTTASTLKYAGAIKKILRAELKSPSEAFVRFFASQISDKRLTQPVLEQFTEIVKDARNQFINERVNERLKSALSGSQTEQKTDESALNEIDQNENDSTDLGIETTQEELDGFNIIKAILYNSVDINRIAIRDTKSYCGILLDNNNRKPICRLHFNYSQKYIGIFSDKIETKTPINDVSEVYQHAEAIRSVINEYDA